MSTKLLDLINIFIWTIIWYIFVSSWFALTVSGYLHSEWLSPLHILSPCLCTVPTSIPSDQMIFLLSSMDGQPCPWPPHHSVFMGTSDQCGELSSMSVHRAALIGCLPVYSFQWVHLVSPFREWELVCCTWRLYGLLLSSWSPCKVSLSCLMSVIPVESSSPLVSPLSH